MMRRRRRGSRGIDFSFDSFLDLVTNVVGIIIRLILVTWVGARAYHSVPEMLRQAQNKAPATPAAEVAVDDPLRDEIDQRRAELAQAEARLLEQLRHLNLTQEDERKQELALALVTDRRKQMDQELTKVEATAKRQQPDPRLEASLAELQERQQRVLQQIRELEKQPPASRQLRYHVPVSKTVTTDEWHFECQHGKVTFFPLGDLEAEIRRQLPTLTKQLRNQWRVADATPVIGAFRLRFAAVRDKKNIDSLLGGGPNPSEEFGGHLEWQAEPVAVFRGESAEQALATDSAFRRLVDPLDGPLSTVTFWVYPDSFAVYRQLRDYLVERGFTVAGRPLPYGALIAGSPRGSASRGQ